MTRLLVAISLVVLFTVSAVNALAQNVAQVDGIIGVECAFTHGLVGDVPGLALSLKTTGNPVLVIYTVQFNGNPTAGITLWPVIDGVTQTSGQRDRFIGDFSGQVADVTFSRIYALKRGSHTFGLRATCQSQVIFSTSWLTVYELPKDKKDKGDDD
jgi:hypothetical protein